MQPNWWSNKKAKGKTNGNGEKVTRHKLEHNDLIRVGWNRFRFVDPSEKDADQTAKIRKSWIPGVYYAEEEK